MTDELTTALARARGLRVASRSAAAAAQSEGLPVDSLAKRLGVSFLLEGTVQREGERLRVAVRLVNAADGFTVWSDLFEESTADLLDVQARIAMAIAAAIRSDIAGAPADSGGGMLNTGTSDLTAYNEYLRGHFMLERRGGEALRQAVQAFNAAIARDSGYARAWAELAQTYAVMPLHTDVTRAEVWPRAVAAAQRALALDSALAPAYAALGTIYNGEMQWADGRAALERAIALDSAYAPAYQWLAENALINGDLVRARALLVEAERRDPGAPIISAVLALVMGASGQHDAAVAKGRDAVSRDPGLFASRLMLGTIYLYAARPRDALRELEAARAMVPNLPVVMGALGYAYAAAGDRQRAASIADTLQRTTSRPGGWSALGKVRLALGDTSAALAALERAVAAKDPFFGSEPLTGPLFDGIRSDPRFARIVAAAGLDASRLTRPPR
jgi:serine/threonine-protein kinase